MSANFRRTAACISVLACFAGPACAQFGNPAGLMPGTVEARPGVPAPGQANPQDRLFVKLVGMGNAGEIAAGRLAQARASDADVKRHGQRMVQDHTAAAERLSSAARPLNLPVPKEPDPDQRAAMARLEGLRGAAFDTAFLQSQLVDHQKTATLLAWILANGQDAGLQAFAREALPTVQGHLRDVRAMLAKATGGAMPPDADMDAGGNAPDRAGSAPVH